MQLEGIHHITAITGDAPRNVDFYARVLGMRLVKKTVNQDDPSVYHLFYADELGSGGADLTFFEYPGAIPGRPGAGMVHRILTRVASSEALDFWAARLDAEGVTTERAGDSLSFADPEGMAHELVVVDRPDAPLIARHREIPPEMALQGFEAVRASSTRPSPRSACSRKDSTSPPPATPYGRRAARSAVGSTCSTPCPRVAASRAPAPSITSPSHRPTRITRAGASAYARSASIRRP